VIVTLVLDLLLNDSAKSLHRESLPEVYAIPVKHLRVDAGISGAMKSASPTGAMMAKKAKKRVLVRYSKDDVRTLKAHSKARTPVKKISKEMKRTIGSLRQKARTLGIGLGHSR
jgi:hypothetical protein